MEDLNNAYKIRYIRIKRKVNLIERGRNGDWMALNGDWNVSAIPLTEWWLKGHWMGQARIQGKAYRAYTPLKFSKIRVLRDIYRFL